MNIRFTWRKKLQNWLDEKGEIAAYRGIMRDITEHKRLEQQLFQAQKMEAVGQLAGGVAHDLNNILTAIMGYGSLLQTKISADSLLNDYVKQILGGANRAAEVTSIPSNHSFYGSCGGNDYFWLYRCCQLAVNFLDNGAIFCCNLRELVINNIIH